MPDHLIEKLQFEGNCDADILENQCRGWRAIIYPRFLCIKKTAIIKATGSLRICIFCLRAQTLEIQAQCLQERTTLGILCINIGSVPSC